MKNLPKVIIKAHQEKRLIEGSPWIFSNEIENFSALKKLEKGSLVEIEIFKQPHFALAYFNPHSLIACRILSYNSVEEIDENFFTKKIIQAKSLREKFFKSPFYRLINSEGDGLAGLIIDRFDDIFVCQISTAGMENLKPHIIKSLQNNFKNCRIIFKNNSELRALEKIDNTAEIEIVDNHQIPDHIMVLENDLDFKIDVKNGQKTGWFYDQRTNRQFVSSIAKDYDVLDAYCYVGGFGLNAIKGNAKNVVFIDSSKDAIELAKQNSQNAVQKFNPNCQTQFYHHKIFDLLENPEFQQRSFDLVLLDPPAFIKSRKDFFSGIRGYEKLVRLASGVLKVNSFLIISSCSHHASSADLIGATQNAFNKLNRHCSLIRNFGAGPDHPLHPALKESEYLKCLTFFVQ
ncbi:MAG: class I SAM-dependent rRNA methyltransferase [Alphaproteobacteria bacterium]|nr:class I SAM-dependent rRNA methyltransferase [Alphaproteobacteria bacterium]